MKRYIRRALKYMVWIVLLFTVIFIIMNLAGVSEVKGFDGLMAMLQTSRGHMLLLVIVGLSALYPLVGFSRREIPGRLGENRKELIEAMDKAGFRCESIVDGVMCFRAKSPLKKVSMIFEDNIEISSQEGLVIIEGIRREVVKIEYRLNSLLMSKE